MMIHVKMRLKDVARAVVQIWKMSEGNTFYQQANIDQIDLKTCQKLQRQESANRAWFLIPRDACDVI